MRLRLNDEYANRVLTALSKAVIWTGIVLVWFFVIMTVLEHWPV